MIDTKELRRLAQAAMPGPDGVSLSWIKFLQDFQQEANPAAISEILDHLEATEKERDALRALVVMRFDLDCPPQFTQGYELHDLIDPVTAEHCRWFVAEIERLRDDCDALRADKATLQQMTYSLKDRLEVAENENAKLRIALAEKVTSETTLRDLSVGNGSINATFDGGAMHLLVDAFANQFEESGAANYIEMQFHSNVTGPLVVTLQRVNGKTPHQLRAEAEQERDALRAAVQHEADCVEACKSKIEQLRAENAALRAKIESMEQQEPSHWVCTVLQSDGGWKEEVSREAPPEGYFSIRDIFPLYLAPGAQGEKK